MQPDRGPVLCDEICHDLIHEGSGAGERIVCDRPACTLSVDAPNRVRCLHGAYRVWDRMQGLLDGVEHG